MSNVEEDLSALHRLHKEACGTGAQSDLGVVRWAFFEAEIITHEDAEAWGLVLTGNVSAVWNASFRC